MVQVSSSRRRSSNPSRTKVTNSSCNLPTKRARRFQFGYLGEFTAVDTLTLLYLQ